MDSNPDIAPPLATTSATPASRCRPPFSARPTRASCISFAAASGRDDQLTPSRPRPVTARPGTAHRQLTLSSSTQWQFLTKTPSEDKPMGAKPRPSSSRASRLRARPATARVDSTSPSFPQAPKRPATCRGPRQHVPAKPAPSSLVLVDLRVIHDAARHETEQELYTGPLDGKSVDIQQPELLAPKPFRDSCVVKAISLSEFHRTRAFHARAKGDQYCAITHLEKLMEFVPHDHVAIFQLAVAYEKIGRLDDAQRMYQRVLPMDGDNPFLHFNIGNLLMKMDLVEDAIGAYTTAIQKNGSGKCQNLAFYRQRGAAFRKHGDFEKAAQDYARVHAVHRQKSVTSEDRKSSQSVGDSRERGGDLIDSEYSAEQIYSTTHFASQCTPPDQAMSSIDFLHHARALAIAAKPSHARTEDELLLLGDELARRFTCCAALDSEARKFLSTRVIAGASLPRGAMLVEEGTTRGEFIFMIARGRVTVHKRFTPRVTVSFENENQETERATEGKNPNAEAGIVAVAWEVLRSTVYDDPIHSEDDKEAVFQSIMKTFPVVDLVSWRSGRGAGNQHQVVLAHLTMGDVCGRQGRFSHQARSYSAVVSEQCDFFAISWADFLEVERLHRLASSVQMARFLATAPLFHGLPHDELLHLSERARNCKVVGERVVCTEGQLVNGLLVVREGNLCQLFPSELNRPPNFSVAFSLSGSISTNDRDVEHGGLHFFTQLEHSDDPLLFIHDSAMMHGFLPRTFLPQALERLSKQDEASTPTTEAQQQRSSAAPSEGATNLARGAFFNASSSWIPPRKTRREDLFSAHSGGVTCAKMALITTESSELIFFAASDLRLGLSVKSRVLLQKNMQQINARRGTSLTSSTAGPSPGMSSLRKLVFLKPPSGDDLVRKFLHETDWQSYKQGLVSTIVADARQKRPRSFAARELSSGAHLPGTARSDWKG